MKSTEASWPFPILMLNKKITKEINFLPSFLIWRSFEDDEDEQELNYIDTKKL